MYPDLLFYQVLIVAEVIGVLTVGFLVIVVVPTLRDWSAAS